jgi:hypothetical protein
MNPTGLHTVLMRFFLGYIDGEFRWLLVTVPVLWGKEVRRCH